MAPCVDAISTTRSSGIDIFAQANVVQFPAPVLVFYLLQARLIRGEPLRVVAERVELRGHTPRWLPNRIGQSRPHYLLGEVEIPAGKGPALTGRLDSVETYNPTLYRGGTLPLHYTRARELAPWLDLVAVRGWGRGRSSGRNGYRSS